MDYDDPVGHDPAADRTIDGLVAEIDRLAEALAAAQQERDAADADLQHEMAGTKKLESDLAQAITERDTATGHASAWLKEITTLTARVTALEKALATARTWIDNVGVLDRDELLAMREGVLEQIDTA